MSKSAIPGGVVHSVPADLRKALARGPAALAKWQDITPLARNEWICWIISVKKPETRKQHVERTRAELKKKECATPPVGPVALIVEKINRPSGEWPSQLAVVTAGVCQWKARQLAGTGGKRERFCYGGIPSARTPQWL